MGSCSEQLLKFVHWVASDISPLMQGMASLVGLAGLWFVYQQIRDAREEAAAARHQARREAAYSLIDGVAFGLLEKAAHTECKKVRIKFPGKLGAADLGVMRDNLDAYFAVKSILVTLEKLALAYNQEYSECEVIERTYGEILTSYWSVFADYVAAIRKENASPGAYAELEKAAAKIKERLSSSKAGPEA